MSRIADALKQFAADPVNGGPPAASLPTSLADFPIATEAESVAGFTDSSQGGDAGDIRPAEARPAAAFMPEAAEWSLHSASSDPVFAERLVMGDRMAQVCVEQYRRLAGVLHQLQAERGTRVLMIASAQVGDGKSLTAVNLALTLSESYRRRVLLLDADLRRPTLAKLFTIPAGPGLSDGLKAEAGSRIPVVQLSEYLSLLPGGSPDPDPMASLVSGRMQHLIQQAASNFDWVILDTPPVCLLPDTHLLAAMVEAVVFVIGAGSTPFALVQRAIETIGRDRIVGVLLNRVAEEAMADASGYPYRYGYGYGEPVRGGYRRWLSKSRPTVPPASSPVGSSNIAAPERESAVTDR